MTKQNTAAALGCGTRTRAFVCDVNYNQRMNKKLYRIEIEVEPMEGTQLPSDCAGAFVNVYLSSPNIIEAIKSAEAELFQDCYKPLNTYAAFELDLEETDYDTDEEGYPSNTDLMNLQRNGGVWYGPFNCYPHEEDHFQ